MRAVAIIPARMGSNRFPGKVLADVQGQPLVAHVWSRVKAAASISDVLVATDCDEVASVIESIGGTVVRTEGDYPSGSDRVAAVARSVSADVVVNVQADNGEINPSTIDAVVQQFTRDEVQVATPVPEYPQHFKRDDRSKVKAVVDAEGRATRFTRREAPDGLLHLGVYGFRPSVLQRYASWQPGEWELEEQLEQLRLLENGVSIHTVVVDDSTIGVDTPADLTQLLTQLSTGPMGSRF